MILWCAAYALDGSLIRTLLLATDANSTAFRSARDTKPPLAVVQSDIDAAAAVAANYTTTQLARKFFSALHASTCFRALINHRLKRQGYIASYVIAQQM